MEKLIEFITTNWNVILPIVLGVYELIVRLVPTNSKWWSILHILGAIIPNKSKTPLLVFLLLSFGLYAQLNSTAKAFLSVNADSVTYHKQAKAMVAAYGNSGMLAFDKIQNKWKISVDTTWYDLLRAGGGGSNIYTGTSPTTITVGGLPAGSAIASQTYTQILQSILVPYINPSFSSFSNNQTTPVEVGTTLSGSKTFTWSITLGSGTVPTIDLFDVTAGSTLLAGTPNDGSQTQTITTIQLNSTGATQIWRGVGNNTTPSGTFNSSNYTVTSLFTSFFGTTATAAVNSAQVRALPQSSFKTSGANVYILNTGTTNSIFQVDLPPSVSIVSVIDLDALNANITASYVATGTIAVNDAGGTPRTYPNYVMTLGAPYSSNHRHQITTN